MPVSPMLLTPERIFDPWMLTLYRSRSSVVHPWDIHEGTLWQTRSKGAFEGLADDTVSTLHEFLFPRFIALKQRKIFLSILSYLIQHVIPK